MTDTPATKLSREALQDLVYENEQGARSPHSRFVRGLLLLTALCWTFFQLWVASPFNYAFPAWVNSLPYLQAHDLHLASITSDSARSIHLAFALFLAFLAYPATRRSPRSRIPVTDWAFAVCAGLAALYCFWYADELAIRAGRPLPRDVAFGWVGIVLLLEATRRALGFPLVVIGVVCIAYAYCGHNEFIPDALRHKGHSLPKIANHLWLTQEGVFGVALGVSASFVFLFVLFGSLLEKAGAGNYFIKIAFSLLGSLRGGPAKAAVLASGLTGLISGSSIANVVTTGTFTIPLMKRAGFSSEKAGAIEVAAGVDGQIMPPVMGAAAFLMVEYVGISYTEVIRHAFLPAILSYAALLYIVHLEALKAGTKPVFSADVQVRTLRQQLIRWGIIISSLFIAAGVIFYALSGVKLMLGEAAETCLAIGTVIAYFVLIRYASRFPDLALDEGSRPFRKLPKLGETTKAGLYYLLPVIVLLWCLMIEKFPPGTAAFWAIALLALMILTQQPLKNYFRGTGDYREAFRRGRLDLRDGLAAGARNMIGIGTATAAAGIIVGVVSLTGIGNVLVDFVDTVTGNSLLLMLMLTALICLLLGMGMPTTASYIIVASLMAPIVRELGMRNGLDVPLIAIHLFVFYFGIMADVTPPVGLAAFAAAAISGADPMRTGWRAFNYCMRTAMLPFFFIYNTELLMEGVHGWHIPWVLFYSISGMLLMCTVIQRYFIVKNTLIETLLLLVISLIIMIPNVWNDLINPPYKKIDLATLSDATFEDSGERTRVQISGVGHDAFGDMKRFHLYIRTNGKKNAADVLKAYGISWKYENRLLTVSKVRFDSPAEHDNINTTYAITKIRIPQPHPSSKIMYIPAMLLLGFVVMSQLARRRKETALGMLK